MKKIVSFFAILFAICAIQAQTTISDDFESYTDFAINPTGQWTFADVDADSTYGFNGNSFTGMYAPMAFMVFNPSQTMTDLSSTMPPHSGSKFLACFASANTTNNDWIISPDLGTHEGAMLTFWARSYTSSYGLERFKVGYSTTTNSTSSFTFIQGGSHAEAPETWTQYTYIIPANAKHIAINCVSDDAFIFMLDDISIVFSSDPTLFVSTNNVDFGSLILGDSTTTTINISAIGLSDNIIATTTAPFEVSADGTTFGSTVMIDTAGGTLHIKYVPSVAGVFSEDLTLSSTGLADVIVTLTGSAIECNTVTAFPYSCGFESTEATTLCWQYIDVAGDGDGEYDEFLPAPDGDGNTFMVLVHSGDAPVGANDWMISPEFEIGEGMYVSFDYLVGVYFVWPYPETFSVWAIPQGMSIDSAVNIVPPASLGDGSLQNMIVDLSTFADQTIKIGIKLETPTEDGIYFAVDNFIVDFITSSLDLLSADTASLGNVAIGNSNTIQATISAMSITNNINVETAGDYLVSTDGTAYSASITLPGDTLLNFTRSFYIKFSPSAAGTITENVIVSSIDTEDTLTITATGVGIECNTITDFPYQVDFTQEAPCWTISDDNNDNATFHIDEEEGYAYYGYSSSNAANDWLISPAMAINDEDLALTIGYSCSGASYPEKFSVWVITDLSNHTAGTQVLAPVTVSSITTFYTPHIDLTPYSGQTIYIGIKAESETDMYMLYIDDVKIDTISNELVIIPSVETLAFGEIQTGNTANQTISVTAYNLTQNMTISVTGDYTLSLNDTNFNASVTIPGSGNLLATCNLYVKFAPTTTGSHNTTITFTSDTVTETVSVTASAFSCDTRTLPFTEGFDGDIFPPACWTINDVDGDGYNWMRNTQYFHNGNGCAMSNSYVDYVGPITPNNYLISPKLTIPSEGAQISWFVGLANPEYYEEHYQIKISTTGTNPSDFTTVVFEETLPDGNWNERTASLSQFAGQDIYFAFVHNNVTDIYIILIDDINVQAGNSINETTIDNSVNVYPNPATSVLNITSATTINQVEMFNTTGQLIHEAQSTDNNLQINTIDFAQGFYFVKIYNENGVTTKKVSIIK